MKDKQSDSLSDAATAAFTPDTVPEEEISWPDFSQGYCNNHSSEARSTGKSTWHTLTVIVLLNGRHGRADL